jgi:tol-pal system protein YbgF
MALWAATVAALMLLAWPARAALFDDDEARRAILELRQRVQQMDQANARQDAENAKSNAQLLEQIRCSAQRARAQRPDQSLRGEIARPWHRRAADARPGRDVQRRRKTSRRASRRIRKLEPMKVGRWPEFMADPEEKRQFEDALVILRNGDFDKAAVAFGGFLRRYPASGYADSARFWQGNALYGKRDYKEAIVSFRALVNNAPDHLRAPEALLAVANCQVETKDTKGARATIAELIKTYPKSEAAAAGRERLAALK